MHVQAFAPRVFFSTCDDKPEALDALKLKLQETKRALTAQVARLAFVQEPIQWKSATDYKVLTTQLIDIEAKIQGVFARLCSSCGIDKQIALQANPGAVLELIREEKRIELELALTLKKLKKLKKLCESKVLREAEPKHLPKARVAEADVSRFSGHSWAYGFWKSVPYTIQGAYSAPAMMGGGYYQATGKLGSDLEKQVGQRLYSMLKDIEEHICGFCSWKPDAAIAHELAGYEECLAALYKTFTDLYATVETIELDVLTKPIHDYAYGLKYAFSEACSLLKVMGRCMQKPANHALEGIHDLEVLYGAEQGNASEFEKVSLLNNALQRIIQAESDRPADKSKKFFDQFLCRLHAMLQDVHANIDPAFLQLNQKEARVFDMLVTMPQAEGSVMSYLAKRMVAALYFPMKELVDIELELALHICAGFDFDDEAFRAIYRAYEGVYSSRRLHTRQEYAEAVVMAGRIVEMLAPGRPTYAYFECCQMYAEFSARLGDDKATAFRPVLILPLERAAKEHGLPCIWEVEEHLFAKEAAAALFASSNEAKLAALKRISLLIEDVRYENHITALSSDVRQVLCSTSMQKLLAFSYQSPHSLGTREMRLFVDGPVEQFLHSERFALERLDVQMALYKLIKKERERGGHKPLLERFTERYSESEFTRWYASFDDLYRKNVLTQSFGSARSQSMQPVASDETVRHIASLAADNTGATADDKAIWDAVVAKKWARDLVAKVPGYLLRHIPAVLAKNSLDVSLELVLYSIKSDRTDRALYELCRGNKALFDYMSQYDRVYQHYRSDILLKEALDVLLPVLRMDGSQFDIFAYACAWQKCIEFARKPGLEGVEKEQHTKLAALLYARLDALSKKPGVQSLLGPQRYCSLTSNQIYSGTNDGMFLRLLACCLFGSDPAERQQAQVKVTNLVEMQNAAYGLSEAVMSLLYENTMDKIIKGGFDVGSTEKAMFIDGPVSDCIKKEQFMVSDCKLLHALFFLMRKERLVANGEPPLLDRFLQLKGRAAFNAWYKQYQQFLASGPIADNPELADWQAEFAFSKYLTESWE